MESSETKILDDKLYINSITDGFKKLELQAIIDHSLIEQINSINSLGKTPLMLAATYGCTDITKKLLSSDADIDVIDDSGNSALMYATLNGHVKVAGILIENGADLTLKNLLRESPLLIALKQKQEIIANRIIYAMKFKDEEKFIEEHPSYREFIHNYRKNYLFNFNQLYIFVCRFISLDEPNKKYDVKSLFNTMAQQLADENDVPQWFKYLAYGNPNKKGLLETTLERVMKERNVTAAVDDLLINNNAQPVILSRKIKKRKVSNNDD